MKRFFALIILFTLSAASAEWRQFEDIYPPEGVKQFSYNFNFFTEELLGYGCIPDTYSGELNVDYEDGFINSNTAVFAVLGKEITENVNNEFKILYFQSVNENLTNISYEKREGEKIYLTIQFSEKLKSTLVQRCTLDFKAE